ncbi:hypothetical protein KKH05_00515 [Patescibacteria group bacterium]|nr:hypothetical protein [Patescibacteria group bacterium]
MKEDKLIIYAFGLSLAFLVISGLTAFLSLPTDAGDLILRFDNFQNEVVWSGGVGIFYGILGVVLVMAIINLMLANYIYDKEKFLSYVFAIGTTIITFLFLVATGSIAFIN